MASERLPRLQRRILAWLAAEEQRTRGTMAASHEDLVRALVARGHDKGNLSTSLKGLAAKGLVTIARTPGGKAEAVDLTAEGRTRVAALAGSCELGGRAMSRGFAILAVVTWVIALLSTLRIRWPPRPTVAESRRVSGDLSRG